jgi:2-polyprenyl-3-methyl-5-hydroxy-6-metoxy-1,4-benzoquinol methylase
LKITRREVPVQNHYLMPSRFTKRSEEIEIMDDLQCQGPVVDQTLRELEFINLWLGGNFVTLDAVSRLGAGHKTLSIADLGCGGGDLLKMLAEWGRKNQLSLTLTGMDANPHIVGFARNNCRDYSEINIEVVDIFSTEFSERKYDIVTGTLFYHHFQQEALVNLFSKLKHQVRLGIVINDIHRHWLAYYSIKLLTHFFSKSAMVKFDAPLSVLRAFTREELVDVLTKAGISNFQLSWKWAFRWQVIGRVQG